MDPAQVEFRACLAQIGWNDRQCNAIVGEGFASIDQLGNMWLNDVSCICSSIAKLTNKRGGVSVGCALVHRLKGFVWWVKDNHRCGIDICNRNEWNLQVCQDSTDCMDIEDARGDDVSKLDPLASSRMGTGSSGS
jgi:hypothetical protein